MKRLVLCLAAALSLSAAERPRIARATFAALEKTFDQKLERPADPFNLIGNTRGIYVEGFGTVLTAELNLIVGPTLSPFRPEITRQEIAAIRQKKLERVPVLKEIMRDALVRFASALGTMPLNEQIVLGVSLFNHHWEDVKDLPTQIVMQASRQALLDARADPAQAQIKVQEY